MRVLKTRDGETTGQINPWFHILEIRSQKSTGRTEEVPENGP